MKFKKGYLWIICLIACCSIFLFPHSASANKIANAYDISQYQGRLNNHQVHGLKHEVNFMIIRAQGGNYPDTEANHNEHLMQRNHVPYGAYSYSYYTNPTNAEIEAKELYQRAPKANFYVNDIEQNDAGNTLDLSTRNWANEMHSLTRRPAVIYSGEYFMNNHISQKTRNAYNAVWLAAYGSEPAPNYHYDLWQSTDRQYSPALNQRVDADVFPEGYNKPMSFWTNKHHRNYRKHKIIQSINDNHVNQNTQNSDNSNANITPIKNKPNHIERQTGHLATKIYKLIINNKHVNNIPMINNDEHAMKHYRHQLHHLIHRQQTKFRNDNALHSNLLNLKRTVSLQDYYLKELRKYILKHNHINNNDSYYHSKHIHHLVVARHKIALYAINSHKIIGYAYRNYTIHHIHFRKAYWHHHIIYRAIGRAKGVRFSFSCNKHCVRL